MDGKGYSGVQTDENIDSISTGSTVPINICERDSYETTITFTNESAEEMQLPESNHSAKPVSNFYRNENQNEKNSNNSGETTALLASDYMETTFFSVGGNNDQIVNDVSTRTNTELHSKQDVFYIARTSDELQEENKKGSDGFDKSLTVQLPKDQPKTFLKGQYDGKQSSDINIPTIHSDSQSSKSQADNPSHKNSLTGDSRNTVPDTNVLNHQPENVIASKQDIGGVRNSRTLSICGKIKKYKCQMVFITLTILMAFVLYLMVKIHTINNVTNVNNIPPTVVPMTTAMPNSYNEINTKTVRSVVTFYPDWKQLEKAEKINITWREHASDFVLLANKGRAVKFIENGTYILYLTLNLDVNGVTSYNSKQLVHSSMICIKNSKVTSESCQKHKLLPYSALTVSMTSVFPMQKGDIAWVSVEGVDQIYKADIGNHLVILKL